MEDLVIKKISGWQNNEYVLIGYTDTKDIEEFITCNVSAFNKFRSNIALINLNSDSIYSIQEAKNTIVLHHCNSIIDLRNIARFAVREHDVQIFFIDNMKMLLYPNICGISDANISIRISQSLRGLCRELKLPIISFLPITPTEKNTGYIDINCIGDLQFDADIVIFLMRDEKHRLKLFVAKNRNGFISEIYNDPNRNKNLEILF